MDIMRKGSSVRIALGGVTLREFERIVSFISSSENRSEGDTRDRVFKTDPDDVAFSINRGDSAEAKSSFAIFLDIKNKGVFDLASLLEGLAEVLKDCNT